MPNASLVRNIEPILFKLRTLSITTTTGIFADCKFSSTLFRFNSSRLNFRLLLIYPLLNVNGIVIFGKRNKKSNSFFRTLVCEAIKIKNL